MSEKLDRLRTNLEDAQVREAHNIEREKLAFAREEQAVHREKTYANLIKALR